MPCAHSWAWGFLIPNLGECLIFSRPQICAGLLKFQQTPDLGAVHQRIFAPQFRGGYRRFVRQATSLGISGLWVRYRTGRATWSKLTGLPLCAILRSPDLETPQGGRKFLTGVSVKPIPLFPLLRPLCALRGPGGVFTLLQLWGRLWGGYGLRLDKLSVLH